MATPRKRKKYTWGKGYRGTLAQRVRIAQPPCIGCRHMSRCAAKQLACADYGQFVDTGRVGNKRREPTRQGYIDAHPDEDEGVWS